MPVDVLDQLRLRYMTHFRSRHFAQSFPLLSQGLFRGKEVQIVLFTTEQMLIPSISEAKKVKSCSLLTQILHGCLFTVDFQSESAFQQLFDIACDSASKISGENDKVIGISDKFRLRPVPRPVSTVKVLVEKVQKEIRQQRRYDAALCEVNDYAK